MADFVVGFLTGAGSGGGLGAVRAVREGLPIGAIGKLLDAGTLSATELEHLRLPHRRPGHHGGQDKLTPEQSDRLLRVLRIIREAEGTFGNEDKARRWLRRPSAALDGQSPLDLLDTEVGARSVERLLGQIAHGIAA